MKPYSSLTLDELIDGEHVRPMYRNAVLDVVEGECARSQWRIFHDVAGSIGEGIQYQLDEGSVDWIVGGNIPEQQVRVRDKNVQMQLLAWMRQWEPV